MMINSEAKKTRAKLDRKLVITLRERDEPLAIRFTAGSLSHQVLQTWIKLHRVAGTLKNSRFFSTGRVGRWVRDIASFIEVPGAFKAAQDSQNFQHDGLAMLQVRVRAEL